MHRIDPGRPHRLADPGDLVDRIVGPVLVQVGAAGVFCRKSLQLPVMSRPQSSSLTGVPLMAVLPTFKSPRSNVASRFTSSSTFHEGWDYQPRLKAVLGHYKARAGKP